MSRFEIEVDIPFGFEPTGEFRRGRRGECVLINGCRPLILTHDDLEPRLILCKSKKYGPPTLPADYGIQAEFSNASDHSFVAGKLIGWERRTDDDDFVWHDALSNKWFRHCRIEVGE